MARCSSKVVKYGLSQWPQLIASNNEEYYFAEQGNISFAYGVEQIPSFILINKNGIIVGRWSHLTPDTIKEIEQLIN